MKRLLIFYPYFTPAYKAGGPIQSIKNLVDLVKDDFEIDVVCSAFDLGQAEVLPDVVADEWNRLSETVCVLYIKSNIYKTIKTVISKRRPDIIYLNGIFLPFFSWLPLIFAKANNVPVIITPRGMLQRGAMAAKSFKKNLSIGLLKSFNLLRNVTWQATDDQEEQDIRSYFGQRAEVRLVGNVPRSPMKTNMLVQKEKGDLKLVFLSLIARKKNLDLILRILKEVTHRVSLDIYGPVKDSAYWQECLSLTSNLLHPIRYLGPVSPDKVRETLKGYHAFILLTKGENFGHAIYEALSTGTPAIISQFTPWGQLHLHRGGITVDINKPETCVAAIKTFISYDQRDLDSLSEGAYQLATAYYSGCDFKKLYVEMFSEAASKRHTGLQKTW